MGIQIGSDAIYTSGPNLIVDDGIFVAGSTSNLGWTEDNAICRIIKIGLVPSLTSTLISIKIMRASSVVLGGSTPTLPSRDHAVFSALQIRVHHPRLLKRHFDDCFGGIVRN